VQQRVAITHYAIARLALKKGNNKGALFELDKAINASAGFPDFFIVRAKVRLALGQFEESLEDLLTVLRIDPENAEAKVLLNVRQTPQVKTPKKQKAAPRPVLAAECHPYTISDLRTNPFDFISGAKRIPRKYT
jgi:tetratricopeptide (TPR) repeat protein